MNGVVEYRVGDLFDQTDVDAIGHGVNLRGLMGSGIAKVFKQKFPDMHEEYVEWCADGTLSLGDAVLYEENGTRVLNLATQIEPGANASLAAVEVSLFNAVMEMERQGLSSFAIPQIGAGIGGLEWDDVNIVIQKVAATTDVQIVVVVLG